VLDATAPTAQALRLTFLPVDVRSPGDFDGAFAVLIRERVDALTATENPLNGEHRSSIVSFAAGNRLPTVFGERAFVDAGGLMSYGIVVVAFFAARAAGVLTVKMTLAFSRTNSPMSPGKRSLRPSAHRSSSVRFWPST
jgi:hypothetical protein